MNTSLYISAEQHVSVAKFVRDNARALAEPARRRAIQISNSFLTCAVLSAKDRGGISLLGFEFEALTPDWTSIDTQIVSLLPISPILLPSVESTAVSAGQSVETGNPARQIRQLIKQALETPTPANLTEFLDFSTRFRRLAIWNARMVYIQRPGARIIASEFEWETVGRHVLPDAVPIIILWPFSPIRFVYELQDTGPPIDRESINDPFAAKGEFPPATISALMSNLKKQKSFKIEIELRRHGFSYAGTAAAHGVTPIGQIQGASLQEAPLGDFVRENSVTQGSKLDDHGIPTYRITVNDRLELNERFVTIAHELGHIFCGHLGGCTVHSSKNEESGWPDRQSLGKCEKEIEAEAVAYMVSSRAGVVTRSASYLTTYAQKANMAKIDVDLIVRAAARTERLSKLHYGSMAFYAQT
jgi:IrrE N-terminal-like domain